ncbi:MAG: 23S rRNA pseudouridine(2604) synthase RluF [Bacteroidota bacterium]|nr:23S rRNA pseudouridine(2604) synthase RluF [Bacteroidota bacterium]
MTEKIRLNKFISDSGVCSRREADKQIELGHVMVNGKRAKLGDQVSIKDKVLMSGNLIEAKTGDDFVFLAFNKPAGIISTTEIGAKGSIVDYIGYHERIFPVGRLDKDSQGLIFMTNNGDMVNKILRAGNNHEKEYLVTVNKPLTDDFILKMGSGVPILGEITRKCQVIKESAYSYRIVLVQGLNRQIRRMSEYFDYEVVRLERTRIMNINLKGLPIGEWRQLELNEMSEIMAAIANSSSTKEASVSRGKRQEVRGKNTEQESRSIERETKRTAQRAPVSTPAKKSERSSNPNPKSRELRERSSNSNGKKTGTSKNVKPSSGNFGKRGSGTSGKR